MRLVNTIEFAEILDCNSRTVTDFIKDGMPCEILEGDKSKYRINTGIAIRWLRERAVDRALDGSGLQDEDIQLKRTRRIDLELKIAERKKEVLPIDYLKGLVFSIAGVYTSQLDGLASRMAGELSACNSPAEIRQLIHEETRRIRNATAGVMESELERFYSSGQEVSHSGSDSFNQLPADS
jgi:phage terminase Nu1 subunit (DNA packaging protein)